MSIQLLCSNRCEDCSNVILVGVEKCFTNRSCKSHLFVTASIEKRFADDGLDMGAMDESPLIIAFLEHGD